MLPSEPTQLRIAELRNKAREGSLSLEETREAIRLLRADRLAMPPGKTSPTKKAVINADDLLADLGI